MAGKREKVLFLDIDEVFTTAGKPQERRVVEESVARLVKARDTAGYTRFAFITARSGKWVLKEFYPFLQKHGLAGSSTIHCENGLYEIVNGKFELSPEAQAFMPIRQLIAREIEAEIAGRGVQAANASENAGKIVQVRFEPRTAEDAEALRLAVSAAIARLKETGRIPKAIRADITKSGVNIFPNIDKGTTARMVERRILSETGRKVRGKAIGDRPEEDGLMARGRHVKWRGVRGFEEFNRLMDNLTYRRPAKRRRI